MNERQTTQSTASNLLRIPFSAHETPIHFGRVDLHEETASIGSRRSSRRKKMGGLLHPEMEALCDRTHMPRKGYYVGWTPRGKMVIWTLVFLSIAVLFISQPYDMISVRQYGLVPDILLFGEKQVNDYSLISMPQTITKYGYGDVPAYEYSATLFVFTAIFPILHVIGLAFMWTIPMSVERQSEVFHILEFFSAW